MKNKSRLLGWIIFILIITFFSNCKKEKKAETLDPNGNWLVTCSISTCYSATVSKIITVSGGNFDATIGNYTSNGCPETVSIKGTLTLDQNGISGNELLTGSCCNGGNGFGGTINTSKSPMEGDSDSAWGSIHWEKQ